MSNDNGTDKWVRLVVRRLDGVDEIRTAYKHPDGITMNYSWRDRVAANFHKISKRGFLYYKEVQ